MSGRKGCEILVNCKNVNRSNTMLIGVSQRSLTRSKHGRQNQRHGLQQPRSQGLCYDCSWNEVGTGNAD